MESPQRAVRLVVEYDGDTLRVISRQEVAMATPPSDPVRGFEEETGFWLELRDSKGQTLYRRVMHNPVASDVEAFDPEKGITRHTVERKRGVFTVLVPALPEAQTVAFSSPPVTGERALEKVRRLAEFPLVEKG